MPNPTPPVRVADISLIGAYQKIRPAADGTTNGLPAIAETAVKPTGDGVLDPGHGDGVAPTNLKLVFYGRGAATNTYTVRILGWQLIGTTYVPLILWQGTITLSTLAGSAGLVTTPGLIADTIVTVTGNVGVDCQPFSPTGNVPAHLMVDCKGSAIIEVQFSTGGVATACNGLYAWL